MVQSLIGFIKGIVIKESTDPTKQLTLTVSPSATTGTTTTLIAAQTADRTVTLPDSNLDFSTIVTASSIATFTNKTIDADGTGNSITNIENADIKAAAAIDATKIANGTVSNTEFQFLDGVTSNIQAQLNSAAINPMTTSGDMVYGASAGAPTRLAGDTSNTRKFLREQSIATVAQPPAWDTIQAADVPTLNQSTTGTASNITGIAAVANGGTGQTTANTALNALLPSQATNSGKFLTTDGTNSSWATVSGSVGLWTAFTPTGSWVTNTTYAGYKRLVGDNAEVLYYITLSGVPDLTALVLDLPGDLPADSTFALYKYGPSNYAAAGSYLFTSGVGSGGSVTVYAGNYSANTVELYFPTVDATSATIYEPITAIQVLSATNPGTAQNGDICSIFISYKV